VRPRRKPGPLLNRRNLTDNSGKSVSKGRPLRRSPLKRGLRFRLTTSVAAAIVLCGGATAVIGILVPQIATATTDTCGYPTNTTTKTATVFNESTVTRAVQVYGVGTSAKVGVFANDETSLLLGVDGMATQLGTGYLSTGLATNGTYTSLSLGSGTSGPSGTSGAGLQEQAKQGDKILIRELVGTTITSVQATVGGTTGQTFAIGTTSLPVVSFKANANYPAGTAVIDTTLAYTHASNPNLGTSTPDVSGRPQYPALFLTDLTADSLSASNPAVWTGNWQLNGPTDNQITNAPFANDVFGTWSTASTASGTYTPLKPPASNNWNLGPGSDTPSAGFAALGNEGFGTEVRWDVSELPDMIDHEQSLMPGHTYGIQVMTHDGDQNKTGGDVGEFCTTITIPTTTVTTKSTPAISESIGTGSASTSDIANIGVTGATTWSGTLQFYLCGPSASSCSNSTGTAIGPAISVDQTTSQPVSSTPATVTSAGSYCWAAFFTSLTSGVPSGPDKGANECFTVNPVTPTLGTTAGGPVLLGNPVTDKASLMGTANQPGFPVINGPLGAKAGGSIAFFLYGPDTTTTNCSTLATGFPLGGIQVNISPPGGSPPGGDGTYGPVSFTPSVVGTYHWVASYSGNSPNTNSTIHNTDCKDSGEDVTVQQIATKTVTTPSAGSGGTTTFGSTVTDHAVVTAVQSGDGTPTGTVTFFICNPKQTSGGACPDPNGTQVGIAVTTSAVSGSDPPASSADSIGVTANMTGTWCFRAVYTPGGANGANYTGSNDATSGECFTVTDTTASTSGQTWLPNDTATVTSANGASLNGTLSAQLYTDATCGASGGTAVTGQLYQKTLTNATSAADTTLTTNNASFTVSTSTSVSWLITFTSTDPNVGGSMHCESTSLTINN
jgi:hypothetical protein